MTRLNHLLQNRHALTLLVFTVLAVAVAHKTVHTKPFQGHLQEYVSKQGFKLAQVLLRGKPLTPDSESSELYPSGAGMPIVIATVARFDHKLKSALQCHKRNKTCDVSAFKTLFALQYLVALLGLGAIFLLAWVLSRSWIVAILTLVLAFVAGSYGAPAGQLSPFVWLQTLMLLFLLFVALAATRDDFRWTFASGFILGCGALLSVQLLIVGIITALFFWVMSARGHLNLRHPQGHVLVLLAGIALVGLLVSLSPLSHTIQTANESNFLLLLYERASVQSEALSLFLRYGLAHIPIIGNLFERMCDVPTESQIAYLVQHLPNWRPDDCLHKTQDSVACLIQHTFGEHYFDYFKATPGIFMRGLWVGTPVLTLLGLIHLPSLLRFSREDMRLGPTLLVTIPVLSLLAINTLVTANRPEYNVGLVFLLCYATAYLVGRTEVRQKYWKEKEEELT